jgi:hypothetical protein
MFQFPKADVLRARNLETDTWYSWEITKVDGPKTNAKGDGFNFTVTFSLIDKGTELDGKEIQRVFSNKAMGMMIPLVAAVRGVAEVAPEGFQLDTDEIINKKVDGKHTLETYEGQLVGKLETYAPYKKVAGQTTPF